MSRAALLPTPGDPFLLTLWFDNYARWSHVVDRLYIHINTSAPKPVVDWIKARAEEHENTFVIYSPNQIEHGEALRQMVELSTEDVLMLIEDDAFIIKPDFVASCFAGIESGSAHLIGSRRGSCSQWLYDTASQKWGVDNTGLGDNGPNFWPNFLFAKREHLKEVRNFGAKHWEVGEHVPHLNATAPEFQASDTFVEASLQLRAMGLDIVYVPQYHGATDDSHDYEDKKNIWDGYCPWFHVGSLSSGYNGMLKPDSPIDREHFSTQQEKLELERRIVFYKWGLEKAATKMGLPNEKRAYKEAIQRLIREYELNEGRINQRLLWYKEALS